MQNFVEDFLLLNAYCPLPGLGCLKIETLNAQILEGGQLLRGPKSSIVFSDTKIDAGLFLQYIAYKNNQTLSQASSLLSEFCKSIEDIPASQKFTIGSIGNFSKGLDNRLYFEQQELPDNFTPDISLQRVIHPNQVHAVLVGDAERTNEFMNDYLTGTKPVKQYKWWIAASIFFMLSVAAIVIYINSNSFSYRFGNMSFISPTDEPVTYQKVN